MFIGVIELLICAAVATALVGLPILFLRERGRRGQALDGPRCGHCGYNLTGAPANRCPECGKLFIEAGVVTRPEPSVSFGRILFTFFATFSALLMGLFLLLVLLRFSTTRVRQARQPAQPIAVQVAPQPRTAPAARATPSTNPARPGLQQ